MNNVRIPEASLDLHNILCVSIDGRSLTMGTNDKATFATLREPWRQRGVVSIQEWQLVDTTKTPFSVTPGPWDPGESEPL